MNTEGDGCKVLESTVHGIETVTLENGQLSVRIFAGKGGDISQITCLPEGITFLLENEEVLPRYDGRDLHKEPLVHYSELATGGWQEVVPGYGSCGDVEYREKPVGLAATVPWSYKILKRGEACASVLLEVRLPGFPLHLTKKVTLKKGETAFRVEESVTNEGQLPATFTWTQHAAFGGSFLDDTVKIAYPSEKVFFPGAFAASGGKEEDYTQPVSAVRMPDGTLHDLRRMRGRTEDGSFVFTQRAERNYYEMFSSGRGLGLRMKWEREVFPYLRCWYQNTSDGYTLALEPSNYFCHTFEECLRHEMLMRLRAGETRKTVIEFELFRGRNELF